MSGVKRSDLVDIEAINNSGVKIVMFVPENDELCPFEPFKDIKVDYIKWYPEGVGHAFFLDYNEPEFVAELINQLQIVNDDAD